MLVFEMNDDDSELYGGISDVIVPSAMFEFGYGVTLAPTKAHFMRPCLMTFERPEASFPAWQSASGSFGFDLVAELCVPAKVNVPQWFDKANTVWWLAALLRLRATSRLRIPVLSNVSFSRALRSSSHSFWPVDSESGRTRLMLDPTAGNRILEGDLEWIRMHWIEAGQLMHISPAFNFAFQALDQSSFSREPALVLVLLWSALETLFSPARSELRFRVSANIATFLEPPGPGRANLQRTAAKLYDARSAAVHGQPEQAEEPLIATYTLLKRVLLKIVDNNHVPSIAEIETALFGSTS
jgi:hypothetical protein